EIQSISSRDPKHILQRSKASRIAFAADLCIAPKTSPLACERANLRDDAKAASYRKHISRLKRNSNLAIHDVGEKVAVFDMYLTTKLAS
ncbi:MAG TPA: hypothetical protein PLI05_00750, partial [Methanotrichaceae archaeon]|nr:hypothetical protein [Methanotrichaceae archaeon]HQI90314.1 hypothetical protein [Methanotrichaceae archaeon]